MRNIAFAAVASMFLGTLTFASAQAQVVAQSQRRQARLRDLLSVLLPEARRGRHVGRLFQMHAGLQLQQGQRQLHVI